MGILAVDIVLIPPVAVLDQCITLNHALADPHRYIPLDRDHVVPHLTLAMAMVSEADLPLLKNSLIDMARRYQPLELVFDSIYQITLEDGRPITGLNVARNQQLQQMHEDAMGLLMPYRQDQYQITSLADHEGADAITLDFIRNFPNGSGPKFGPHVTIGYGALQESQIPREPFTTEVLALYQLGNYCTCRELLFQQTLQRAQVSL